MRDHGGNLDAAVARFGAGDWIDLSTGINRRPYPVPALPPEAWTDLPRASATAALMEAAAAYVACVEGRPHFSRPQIMRQVAALEEAGAASQMGSREDGLRSFGTLLRHGKIVKVRRGQYALTESSHLLTEARKITG